MVVHKVREAELPCFNVVEKGIVPLDSALQEGGLFNQLAQELFTTRDPFPRVAMFTKLQKSSVQKGFPAVGRSSLSDAPRGMQLLHCSFDSPDSFQRLS